MKKKNIIPTIILISVVSLIGVVISEISSKRETEFNKEKFDSRVKEVLVNIVNQLGNYIPKNSSSHLALKYSYTCYDVENIGEIIPLKYFNSIVSREFEKSKITTEFEDGIISTNHNTVILGEAGKNKNMLFKTEHSLRLTCMWEKEAIYLAVYFPNEKSYLNDIMSFWLILTITFYFILVISLTTYIYYLVKERRLAILKTNFTNNMAHEFKTPISTIAITSELLFKPEIYKSEDKLTQYATIIHEENNKLNQTVERMLQIALLERGHIKLKKEEVDVHEILTSLINNFSILLQPVNGKIITNFNASKVNINVDKHHFNNIISNMLDNAVKYCNKSPEITVITKNNEKGIFITISDNGIGISPENLKQIFKQFFRVTIGDLHDIKGFGLGLFYVKTTVESHGGTVKVTSKVNEGSNFEIFFPY